MNAVLDLLTRDASFTMPPEPYVWRGRDTVARFLAERFSGHSYRLVPTTANGQPAFGLYLVEERTAVAHAHGLVVLTCVGEKISVVTRFIDTAMFSRFGLPGTVQRTVFPARHAGPRSGGMGTVSDDIGPCGFWQG